MVKGGTSSINPRKRAKKIKAETNHDVVVVSMGSDALHSVQTCSTGTNNNNEHWTTMLTIEKQDPVDEPPFTSTLSTSQDVTNKSGEESSEIAVNIKKPKNKKSKASKKKLAEHHPETPASTLVSGPILSEPLNTVDAVMRCAEATVMQFKTMNDKHESYVDEAHFTPIPHPPYETHHASDSYTPSSTFTEPLSVLTYPQQLHSSQTTSSSLFSPILPSFSQQNPNCGAPPSTKSLLVDAVWTQEITEDAFRDLIWVIFAKNRVYSQQIWATHRKAITPTIFTLEEYMTYAKVLFPQEYEKLGICAPSFVERAWTMFDPHIRSWVIALDPFTPPRPLEGIFGPYLVPAKNAKQIGSGFSNFDGERDRDSVTGYLASVAFVWEHYVKFDECLSYDVLETSSQCMDVDVPPIHVSLVDTESLEKRKAMGDTVAGVPGKKKVRIDDTFRDGWMS
ncbi:hypothetical protein BC829DRAFT_416422 [Chytridium lagenaria]|nr:hypothetical protein BC829DRAFT_416422 [Chytridium lagenaria]